jgi:type II secretory pathway component PulF
MSTISPLNNFAYTAQTVDGEPITGTIDAENLDDASRRLSHLRLRLIELLPSPPRTQKLVGGADFIAFNEQLANLTGAGLPVEQGLRLVADDAKKGLSQSIHAVIGELERGVPLAQAFANHGKQFPPLYSKLIDAGVRSNNLAGVLLNLGRHLELVTRLRAAIWRAAAYPVMILIGMLLLILYVSAFVVPTLNDIYKDFNTRLPTLTQLILVGSRYGPAFAICGISILLTFPLLTGVSRLLGFSGALSDFALSIPIVGPILRSNLVARWCDAMHLSIQGNADLPGAMALAADIVGSPALRRDTNQLIGALQAGRTLADAGNTRVIPKSAMTMVHLACTRSDLPEALHTLSQMYQQQAEIRLAGLQTVLMPMFIVFIGMLLAFTVIGLMAPLISLIQSVSSPGFH